MKLLKENLEPDVAYMVDTTGNIIPCQNLHPYLIRDNIEPLETELEDLIDNRIEDLQWFIDNTRSSKTRQQLRNLLRLGKEFSLSEFRELNEICNSEWMRVRGNSSFGPVPSCIYFRIYSSGFNWFNVIWQIVYENRNLYDTVTVCKDEQSTGEREYYYRKGDKEFNFLPTEEFLNLPGNPVVESI